MGQTVALSADGDLHGALVPGDASSASSRVIGVSVSGSYAWLRGAARLPQKPSLP